jgi:hypothetical protein
MKLGKSVFRFGVLVGALLIAASVPQRSFAQTDPLIGTWKLNLAKSTYKPGPAPRSVVFTAVAVGQDVQVSGDAIDAAGMPGHLVFTTVYDGKIHPVTGSAFFDGNSIIRTDAYTREGTLTKDGVLVQTSTFTFSMDGRTLTLSVRGLNAAGQRTENVSVYDKQ